MADRFPEEASFSLVSTSYEGSRVSKGPGAAEVAPRSGITPADSVQPCLVYGTQDGDPVAPTQTRPGVARSEGGPALPVHKCSGLVLGMGSSPQVLVANAPLPGLGVLFASSIVSEEGGTFGSTNGSSRPWNLFHREM